MNKRILFLTITALLLSNIVWAQKLNVISYSLQLKGQQYEDKDYFNRTVPYTFLDSVKMEY